MFFFHPSILPILAILSKYEAFFVSDVLNSLITVGAFCGFWKTAAGLPAKATQDGFLGKGGLRIQVLNPPFVNQAIYTGDRLHSTYN